MSVALATGLAPSVFVVHVLLCRWLGARRAIRWMFVSFVVYAIAFVLLSQSEGLVAALCTVGFWCLGYMEAFSMLCRGFSLSVLVQLDETPGQTLDDVMRTYGGVGANGLMDKRLSSLESLGLVLRGEHELRLTGFVARWLGRSTRIYKILFRMGDGG